MMTVDSPFTASNRDVLLLIQQLTDTLSSEFVVDSVDSSSGPITVRFGELKDGVMLSECPKEANE